MGSNGMSEEDIEEPSALTGVVSGTSEVSAIGPSPFRLPPTATSISTKTFSTSSMSVDPPKIKKKKKRVVSLPPRFTRKVLLAFIDEDNPDDSTNVVWAANLEPDVIEMSNSDGETYLTITLSLEDVYGNLKNPDED